MPIQSADDVAKERAVAALAPYNERGDCSYLNEHIDNHVTHPTNPNGRWVCLICHPLEMEEVRHGE